MEGRTAESIWGLEREAFIHPYAKIPKFHKPFEVHTNISDFIIGGVFM